MWTQETWSLVLNSSKRRDLNISRAEFPHLPSEHVESGPRVRRCGHHAQSCIPRPGWATLISCCSHTREQGLAPALSVAPGSYCQTTGAGIREEAYLTSVVIIEVLFLSSHDSRTFSGFPV